MNVIIFAPCNIVTGGVELAHQLCYELNAYAESTGADIMAKMCYNDISKSFEDRCRDIPEDKDAPDRYAIYNTEHITDRSVIDREDALYRERIHGEKKRFEQETAAFAEAICRM